MKLKLCACLMAGAAMTVTQALAAPVFLPYLSVDVDGYNDGSIGPTQAGYQSFPGAEGLFLDPSIDWGNSGSTGLTKTFATSQGNVTATMIGVNPGSSKGARDRGANTGGISSLYQDFVFAQRNNANGFGQNFIKIELSGLLPNQQYEFTGFAREAAFNTPDTTGLQPLASYQAWTDLAALGGLDGPGAWLDANVGAGASYQPVTADPNPGLYKNPIPTLARTPVSGPDSLSASDPYFHSASIITKADATGKITVYTWSDPNGFGSNVQGATLINGFQLGVGTVPEPASFGLLALGLAGFAGLRRRVR
jgi:hypothetical protein